MSASSCITKHIKDKALRDEVVNAIKTIQTDGLITAEEHRQQVLQQALDTLYKQRTAIRYEAYNQIKSVANVLTKPEVGVDTTLTATEPTFNRLKAWAKAKPLAQLNKSIMHKYADLQTTLNKVVASKEALQAFMKKHLTTDTVTPEAELVIKDMAQSINQLADVIQRLYVKKGISRKTGKPYTNENWKKYIYQERLHDMIGKDGNLNRQVATAIAVEAYKWQATQAQSTLFNNSEAIAKILGLPKDTTINNSVFNVMSDIGVSEGYLLNQLGQNILKQLGLELTKNRTPEFQSQLINSLGFMAIAAMESEGIIENTPIMTGEYTDGSKTPIKPKQAFGLDLATKLTNGVFPGTLSKKDLVLDTKKYKNKYRILRDANGKKTTQGIKTVSFYKIKNQYNKETKQSELTEDIQTLQDHYGDAPHVVSLLFTGEKSNAPVIFATTDENGNITKPHDESDKAAMDKPMPLKGTAEKSTSLQARNLRKYDNEPFVAIGSMINLFTLLSKNHLSELLGLKDKTAGHVTTEKSIEGKNRTSLRAWNKLQQWMQQAASQEQGLHTPFYIMNEFMVQGRARQISDVSTQNILLHRHGFIKEGMQTFDFDPNGTSLASKRLQTKFLLGVGLAFDLEISKEHTIQNVLDKTNEFLAQEHIVPAINAIRGILSKVEDIDTIDTNAMEQLSESDSTLVKAIADGIKDSEEPATVLHGLVEYAKYMNAKEANQKFDTTIMLEVDGLNNGPLLLQLNFLTENTNKLLALQSIRNSGFLFHKNQPSVEEHLANKKNHDMYQSTAFAWARALSNIIDEKLSSAKSQEAVQIKNKLAAMTNLIGNISDPDGAIQKAMRKLGKPYTMTTVFGAGQLSLTTAFVMDEVIQKQIHDKLYDISQIKNKDEALTALAELNTNVSTLIGRNFITVNEENLANARTIKLRDKDIHTLTKYVNEMHGQALIQGIKNVYGEATEARNVINKTIIHATSLYNALFTKAVANMQARQPGIPLTVAQYDEITKAMKHAEPYLVTPFKGRMALVNEATDDVGTFTDDKQFTSMAFNAIDGKPKVQQKRRGNTKRTGLADPGVRGPILSIHNIDAAIANMMSGVYGNILNIYDGFYTKINDVDTTAQNANIFLSRILTKYNVAQELADAGARSRKTLRQFAKIQMSMTEAEIDQLESAVSRETYNETDIKKINTKFWIANKIAKKATEYKNIVMNAAVAINHYNMVNGAAVREGKVGNKAVVFKGYDWKNKQKTLTKIEPATMDQLSLQYIEELAAEFNPVLFNKIIERQQLTAEDFDITGMPDLSEFDDVGIDTASELGGQALTADDFSSMDMPDPTELGQLDDEIYGSNKAADIVDNPEKYSIAEEVDNHTSQDIFDRIENTGPADMRNTPEHKTYLKSLIDTIINPVLDTVKLYTDYADVSSNIETQGLFAPENATDPASIFLATQAPGYSTLLNNGIRNSAGTVYVHELLHAVMHNGLQLDSTSTTQLQTLFDYTKDKLGDNGWKQFLNDPTINVTDAAYADEVTAAKERYNHIFDNKDFTTRTQYNSVTGETLELVQAHHLAEFAAIGLTDKNFVKALQNITIDTAKLDVFKATTWKGIKGQTVQATIVNIFGRVASIIQHNFMQSKIDSNVHAHLMNLSQQIAGIETKQKSYLFKALEKEYLARTYVNNKMDDFLKLAGKKFLKVAHIKNWSVLGHALENMDSDLGAGLRDLKAKWDALDIAWVKSTIHEVTQGRKLTRPIINLINRREYLLDSRQQKIIQASKDYYNNKIFKNPLEVKTKVALHKAGIRTDLSSLLDTTTIQGNINEIGVLLADPNALHKATKDLVNQLWNDSELKQFAHFFDNSAEALGWFMATGKGREYALNIHNIKAIANMLGTKNARQLTPVQSLKVEGIVDKLATLYSISYTGMDQRNRLAQLIQEDAAGVEAVLASHLKYKKEAEILLFKDDPYLMQKGYVKSIVNPRHKIATGTIADEAKYAALGYTRSEKPVKMDQADPASEPVYVYIAKDTNRPGNFLKGVMSNTQNQASGTNLYDLDYDYNERLDIFQAKAQIAEDMFKARPARPNNNANPLIAQMDRNGDISTFRYMMNEHTKDTYLEQYNEYDTVMSAMKGSLFNKQVTPELNRDLIDALHEMYEKDFKISPEAYVEISPHSTDKKLRDYWYLMPPTTRNYVQEVWGSQKLYIHKDIMDIALGYRQYSIVQSFEKEAKNRKLIEKVLVDMFKIFRTKRAFDWANKTERRAIAATTMAKTNIVVRNVDVIGGNYVSNVAFLITKQMSSEDIIKHTRVAMRNGLVYQEDERALGVLKEELKTLSIQPQKHAVRITELQKEILKLRAKLDANPVAEFIRSGTMPQIMDDVDVETLSDNLYPDELEKFADKTIKKIVDTTSKRLGNQAGVRIENTLRTAFLTSDREGFKTLNNFVKMSDFVSRYALYKHYMEQNEKSSNPIDRDTIHKQAVNQVLHDFVNFSFPTHWLTQYGNNVGLIWFSKYALRILGVIGSNLKDKPFTTLSTYAISNLTGTSNILNSIPGVTKGLFQGVGTAATVFKDSIPNILPIEVVDTAADIVF